MKNFFYEISNDLWDQIKFIINSPKYFMMKNEYLNIAVFKFEMKSLKNEADKEYKKLSTELKRHDNVETRKEMQAKFHELSNLMQAKKLWIGAKCLYRSGDRKPNFILRFLGKNPEQVKTCLSREDMILFEKLEERFGTKQQLAKINRHDIYLIFNSFTGKQTYDKDRRTSLEKEMSKADCDLYFVPERTNTKSEQPEQQKHQNTPRQKLESRFPTATSRNEMNSSIRLAKHSASKNKPEPDKSDIIN